MRRPVQAVIRSRRRTPRAWAEACAAVVSELQLPTPIAGAQGVRWSEADAHHRRLALYTAVCGAGCMARHVAEEAGLSHTAVNNALSLLEAARDADRDLDALLDRLAEAVAPARRAA